MKIHDVVADSLKKGTGRALIIIRDNQDTDFSEIIFNACINALGYDPQCEGTRSEYLYEIIAASQQSVLLERKLTDAILSEEIEGWDLTQLFAIVKIFAEKGNKTARENLYKKFSLASGNDIEISAQELIDLDGLDALKFVAEVRGKKLLKDNSDWEDGYLLKYTKDIVPESNPLEYLEKMAVGNQYIQTYLKKVEECEQKRIPNPKTAWTYESIKKRIEKQNYSLYGLRKWANRDIMLRIAQDFLNEKDFETSKKYLQAFAHYEFPLDFKYLIPFTQDPDEQIRNYALTALSFFKDVQVREIALTNLNQGVDTIGSLEILANNFEEEDYKLIERILLNTNDDWEFHSISMKVHDIYDKNQTILLLNALQKCYENGHCSICRKKTVELMLRNQILPDWIGEEAVYDCNFDIRELFIPKN